MRRCRPVVVFLALAAFTACGDSESGDSAAATSASSSSTGPSSSGATTSSTAAPDGTILKPGPPPNAWGAATGPSATLTTPPSGKDFESVPCPQEFRPPIGGQSQCVVYADAGGAFA